MIDDDETPKRPAPPLAAPPLGAWSIAELRDYIAALQQEIARVEAAIEAKESHRASVEAVFRAP